MSGYHSEDQAYWRRDDSGQDGERIEYEWNEAREAHKRALDQTDFIDVIWDRRAEMLELAKRDSALAIGSVVIAEVNKYLDTQADLTVFGRRMKGRE